MQRNTANQIIYFQMLTASSQAPFAGTASISVVGDNGSPAAGGGTVATIGTDGLHSYVPTQAETNFTTVAFTATGTLATPTTKEYTTTNGTLTGAYPNEGIIDSGTAQAATSTTLQLRSAAVFADSTLIGAVIMAFGSTQGYWQSRVVNANVGSTDTVTVDAWTVTPSGTVTYVLYASPPASLSLLPNVNAASVGGQTATAAAGVTFPSSIASPTNITAGTITTVTTVNNLAANSVNASALATDAVTEIQAGLATASALATVQADTDNIQTRIPAALVSGRIDASVGAMAANTLTASALAADAVTEILTTQMTESYAADGAAPTLAQALCLIQQSIGEFSVSGTTLTVYKADGTTPAATYTLNDASSPTSRVRAS